MFQTSLKMATRRSPLALYQATFVQNQLQACYPDLRIELVSSDTQGDRIMTPLRFLGGKGLFLKDLEEQLLSGQSDLAVHSLKDVPSELDDRFCLPVVNWRHTAADVCVAVNEAVISPVFDLNGRTVATSSQRRAAQLRHLWPDVKIVDVRGNIGTRLRHLKEEGWDALVLAAAAIERLHLSGYYCHYFDPCVFLPAVGQGILAIEITRARDDLMRLLSPCDDLHTRYCADAEREVSLRLGADCSSALGAFAWIEGEEMFLKAAVFATDGTHQLSADHHLTLSQDVRDPAEVLSQVVSMALIEQGAQIVLRQGRY